MQNLCRCESFTLAQFLFAFRTLRNIGANHHLSHGRSYNFVLGFRLNNEFGSLRKLEDYGDFVQCLGKLWLFPVLVFLFHRESFSPAWRSHLKTILLPSHAFRFLSLCLILLNVFRRQNLHIVLQSLGGKSRRTTSQFDFGYLLWDWNNWNKFNEIGKNYSSKIFAGC